MIKFHVYACSYMFGHVVYVCIHIWRQADIGYLLHSFSPSLLRQPAPGLPSLRLLCDGLQAGCHIIPAFTWMPGSTVRLSILCSPRKPRVGQRHSLQGAQGEIVLPTAEDTVHVPAAELKPASDRQAWQLSLTYFMGYFMHKDKS